MLKSSGNFKNDLLIGKSMEYKICKIIQRKYPRAYVKQGYEKGFDIIIPEILVEVKYDKMSHDTGNYLVEIEYGGNPSGLITTTADYWAIVDEEVIVWIMTETLRYFVKSYQAVLLRGRGDSEEKRAYLISKSDLQNSPLVSLQYYT